MFRRRDANQILSLDREDVLSLYLNVDPALPDHQRVPPAYRIWLKNALDAIEVNGDHDRRMALRELTQRVNERFADFRPNGKAVALFAATDVAYEFDLPMAVENEAQFGRPNVTPLLWLLDEYERYGIVQVDHRQARLITAYLGRAEVKGTLEMELDTSTWGEKHLMPATSSGITEGSMRDAFEQRLEAQERGFWREVAERMAAWVDDEGLERLVIGGDEAAAGALAEMLPEVLAQKVVGTLPLPFHENHRDLLERVKPLAESYERDHETALVERVVANALAGGQGALGPDDVLGALQEGRAQLVAAAWPVAGQAWECGSCGLVVAQSVDACPMCGGAIAQRPLEALLPLLAKRTDARIDLVHNGPAERLAEHGGLGALLRY